MVNDPIVHPMVREIQVAIAAVEKAITQQEAEIALLTLTGKDTVQDQKLLGIVTSTLTALRARLVTIIAAISST
jgi:phage baseplate assembly protein W